MDIVTGYPATIAIVESSSRQCVSSTDEMESGDSVEPNKTNTLWSHDKEGSKEWCLFERNEQDIEPAVSALGEGLRIGFEMAKLKVCFRYSILLLTIAGANSLVKSAWLQGQAMSSINEQR